MKKYVSLLCMLLLILTFAVSCGGNKSSEGEESSNQNETAAENASGPITFKEAIEGGDHKLWFETYSPDGRLTIVDAVFYIDGGKITSYFAGDIKANAPEMLGTLEDYYNLSDEEALKLAEERYKQAWRKEYVGIDGNTEHLRQEMEDMPSMYQDREAQLESWQKTKDELDNHEIPEMEAQDYEILMYLDNTGNNASLESIKTKFRKEKDYIGAFHNSDYELFETVEGETFDAFINASAEVAPFEVYDTYFGGYSHDFKGAYTAILTKCSEDTKFILDKPGTEGITITE